MTDLLLGLTLFGGAAFCMGYLLSWVRRTERIVYVNNGLVTPSWTMGPEDVEAIRKTIAASEDRITL